jgi:hypothetical protein
MLTDKELKRLPLARLDFNMLLSDWGRSVTGLPIDCQVQSQAEWNAEKGIVNARGFIEEPAFSGRSVE